MGEVRNLADAKPREPGDNQPLKPPKGAVQGVAVLDSVVWVELQAFTHLAVHKNPTTEAAFQAELKVTADEMKKDPAFLADCKATIAIYADLKTHCETFDNDIKKGMVDLAHDIVHYETSASTIYDRLIELIRGFEANKSASFEGKLKSLIDVWSKAAPAGAEQLTQAGDIKERFKKYIARLAEEAKGYEQKAGVLLGKLERFQKDLEQDRSKLEANAKHYGERYGAESKEVTQLKEKKSSLANELVMAKDRERTDEIVLWTTPAYSFVPVLGWIAQPAVWIGVGIDLKLTRMKIRTLIEEAAAVEAKLGAKERFQALYTSLQTLTAGSADKIKTVMVHVGTVRGAWEAIAKDLQDLGKKLGRGQQDAKDEDWEFASLDLQAAKTSWRRVAAQADGFRRNAYAKEIKAGEEPMPEQKTGT